MTALKITPQGNPPGSFGNLIESFVSEDDCVQCDDAFECCIYFDGDETGEIYDRLTELSDSDEWGDLCIRFHLDSVLRSAIASNCYLDGSVNPTAIAKMSTRLRRLADICDEMKKATVDENQTWVGNFPIPKGEPAFPADLMGR